MGISRAGVRAMALASLGWSAAALAQAAPDIVVTATGTTPFDQPAEIDKTGVPIGDIPRSIQVVPRALVDQQGSTELRDALRDVSGLTQGGQFAFGFYDRFISRGLNVSFLDDGLPDGTSDLGGYVHSLTAVDRIEVLKGPGSALYGSAEPGGTINLVHARPTDRFAASLGEQYGSYQTTTTTGFVNGGLAPGIDARIDGEYQHSDGFRGQRNETGEIYGSLGLHPAAHDILLRLEYHHLENRPDAIGLPFSLPAGTGRPLDVPRGFRYYTPFAFADQDIKRVYLSDAWTAADFLTVNLRTSYTDRDVDLARNAGGRITKTGALYALAGRQLREQGDRQHDWVIQAEPTWHFATGPIEHVLVTGGEYRRVDTHTFRSTADLPNIANVLDPVVPETSLGSLSFLCNASHSCNDADLSARFYGLYAIEQASWGRLKVRLSGRQNWFDTRAEGDALIPTNPGSEHPCTPPQKTSCPFVPGQPVSRHDQPFTWDVGAVYQLLRPVSVFGGYSRTAYPIFNTEEPQSVGQTPERGTQIEAGLRAHFGQWLSLSSAVFRTTRTNVYTILLVPDPNGPGSIDTAEIFSYRTRGWETDVNLRPLPRWAITGNLTLQHARITDYPQTPAFVGNHVPTVPQRIANLWTSYDLPLPDPIGTLQLAGGVRYREHEFTDAGETRILPHLTAIDLSVAWPHDRWTLRGGVMNLTDRTNWAYSAGTGSGAIPDQGRTFFVSATVRAF